MAADVACGLAYLAQNKYVHRSDMENNTSNEYSLLTSLQLQGPGVQKLSG